MAVEITTLGGGCFWCIEAVFKEAPGVLAVESGYAGGTRPNPTYDQVCSGATGHAEVIRVTFNPAMITYRRLLEIFFAVHDPTQLNRQGADVGTQYRSVIFYHSSDQRDIAETLITELREDGIPVVTEVTPVTNYYPAEEYHQDYFARNPLQPYCLATIPPKLKKLRERFL